MFCSLFTVNRPDIWLADLHSSADWSCQSCLHKLSCSSYKTRLSTCWKLIFRRINLYLLLLLSLFVLHIYQKSEFQSNFIAWRTVDISLFYFAIKLTYWHIFLFFKELTTGLSQLHLFIQLQCFWPSSFGRMSNNCIEFFHIKTIIIFYHIFTLSYYLFVLFDCGTLT